MDASYLSLPSKRTIHHPAGGMSDSNKRFKQFPPSPNQHHHHQSVPAGHVCFRLLCHSSRVGGIIGKSGSIVKQLVQQTGAKIRVEEAPVDCPDRVISVLAPAAISSRISLPASNGFADCEFDVSRGQEALVKVLERVFEVAAETDGGSLPEGRVVSCRLLAEGTHAGSVIGKGGKVVEKIKKDFGVKIRVMKDKLPLCAASMEEIIEIEGEVMGVKRALVSVSRCLQDSQLSDRTRMSGRKPVEVVPRESPDTRLNIPSQHASIPGSVSTSGGHSLSLESDRNRDTRTLLEEVAFRILCSNDIVGGIIGSGGSIIRSLQDETGASIVIGPSVPDCDERLITIAASENPDSQYSATQKATVLVFSRAVDAGIEKGLGGSFKGSPVTARIVVSSAKVGCLLGKGGTIVSEMRKDTGAGIRVLGHDQLPKCVQENDQVVQISGELVNVRDAIYHVTGRLRDNLFSGLLGSSMTGSSLLSTKTNPYGSVRDLPRMSLKEPLRDSSRESFMDLYSYQPVNPSMESYVDRYRYPSGEPAGESFNQPLMNSLRDPLRDSFSDPLGDSLRYPLRDTFRDPLRNSLRDPTLSSHVSVGTSHSLGRHSNLGHGIPISPPNHEMGRRQTDPEPTRFPSLIILSAGFISFAAVYTLVSVFFYPYNPPGFHSTTAAAAVGGGDGGCCRGIENLELWGAAVKWGSEFKLNSSVECCKACKALCSGNQGPCLCDSWVFCGDQNACGPKFGECWLKKQKDVLAPDRQESGETTMWTSGIIFERGEGVVGLETEYGTLHIQLFPDCAPNSVAYILELLTLRHCAGCQFYRAEGRGDSWDSQGNHIANAAFGPPFALIQGVLEAQGTPFRNVEKEACPIVRRGSVAWVGSGPEFFISLADHSEWKHEYTVFGSVLPEDMDIAEKIVKLPTKPDVWNNINVTVLEKPVPLMFRRSNKIRHQQLGAH